jgi:hypothetical protein
VVVQQGADAVGAGAQAASPLVFEDEDALLHRGVEAAVTDETDEVEGVADVGAQGVRRSPRVAFSSQSMWRPREVPILRIRFSRPSSVKGRSRNAGLAHRRAQNLGR